jgi:hypothetical protein
MMKPPQISLSKEDRLRLVELHTALVRANGVYGMISHDGQRLIDESQNPVASVPYCLRWGLKACEELMEKSMATAVEEIWLTKPQLAKRLKLRPGTLNQFIKQKRFVPMMRQGTAYFGLQECMQALNSR